MLSKCFREFHLNSSTASNDLKENFLFGNCTRSDLTLSDLLARRTIIIASWRDRSVSSKNCSAPPRRSMVQVLALGQPSKKLNRSLPTCVSVNVSHVPSWFSFRFKQDDLKNINRRLRSSFHTTMEPPHAFMVLLRSSSATRPAQNIPRSAKYCVATSPIGSFERTTLAPDL